LFRIKGFFTALRSEKVLDLLSSTPARFVPRAPCISRHLRALASRPGEKRGLKVSFNNQYIVILIDNIPENHLYVVLTQEKPIRNWD
jgi:hypothetical protein